MCSILVLKARLPWIIRISAMPSPRPSLRAGRAAASPSAAPGIGISIAVNRHPAARAALVSEPLSARLAREHNDANVIAMGARLIGIAMAKECLDAFLNTEFGGDRHRRRVEKLSNPSFAKEIA
jgi:hypothetical protein